MKKLICIVTLFALLCACVSALAEDSSANTIEFTPTLTYGMDQSVNDWYATETNRCLLTIALGLDLGVAYPDIDVSTWLTNTTIVGKDGSTLCVIGYTDDQLLAITFSPLLNTAACITTDISGIGQQSSIADSLIDSVAQSTCDDGYYTNSSTTMLVVLKQLNDSLNS